MRFISLILITTFLASCSMKGRVESPMWHKNATRAEKIAYYGEQCLGYGFEEGTDGFRNCLMEIEAASKADANALMRNVFNNSQRNRPVNCTTTVTGNVGNTTCY